MRRVLITGGSRGIGAAIARALAPDDFELVLGYRSGREQAEAVADEIRGLGGHASLLGFDVSDREATRRTLEEDVQANGAYWGLVVNAGVTDDGPLASMREEAWDRVLRTNLDGFYNVVQPLVMPLVRLRDGGRIVTMSSYAGVRGNRGQVNYAASKAGLIGATRSLALELAKRSITVNAVAPGFIETDMVSGLPEEVVQQAPLARMGRPEEVGALVRYLFSAEAGYMTGQVVSIDGGLS